MSQEAPKHYNLDGRTSNVVLDSGGTVLHWFSLLQKTRKMEKAMDLDVQVTNL